MSDNTASKSKDDIFHISLLQVIKYLYTHRHFIAIITLAFPAIGGLWAFFLHKPVYENEVTISVRVSDESGPFGKSPYSAIMSSNQEINSKLRQLREYLQSYNFAGPLIDEIEGKTRLIDHHAGAKLQKRVVRGYIAKHIKSQSRRAKADALLKKIDTHVDLRNYSITLTTRSRDPLIAQALLDVVSLSLLQFNYNKILSGVDSVIEFLEKQTTQTADKLESHEEAMAKLQSSTGIISFQAASNSLNREKITEERKANDIKRQLASTSTMIKEIEQELDRLRLGSATTNRYSHSYLTQLHQRLEVINFKQASDPSRDSQLETEKEKILNKLNTIVKTVKPQTDRLTAGLLSLPPRRISETLEEMLLDLKENRKRLLSEKDSVQTILNARVSELSKMPKLMRRYADLNRKIKLTSDLYAQLVSNLQEKRIQRAGKVNDMTMSSRPELNLKPVGIPPEHRFALLALGGLLFAIFALILRFILLPTIRDSGDLENAGLSVAGGLPWYRNDANKIINIKMGSPLVLHEMPTSPVANKIRLARHNIEKELDLSGGNRSETGKVLSVCSVNQGEGKSFVTANLAYAFSLADLKVLVVDADQQKLDMFNYFSRPFHAHMVEESLQVQDIRFRHMKFNEHIHLLDCPKLEKNFCDYLEGKSFKKLMDDLRPQYDIIIIDTPPLEGHLEPFLTLEHSDSFLMIINQRSTLMEDFHRFYDQLQNRVNTKPMAMLNFVYEEIKSLRKPLDLSA